METRGVTDARGGAPSQLFRCSYPAPASPLPAPARPCLAPAHPCPPMERYESLGLVGEGSYGAVLKCRHRESGRLVAIKKFLDSDEDKTVKKIAQREIKLLRLLRHDNLVNLLEVWKRRRRWYLVFEFVERTLLDELELKPQGLELHMCRQYLYQILQATAFCHHQNVIHRDIKPENILISQGGVVKLCDFGFARTVSPSEGGVYTDYVATRWYRPPELLVGDTHYGKPVDVWAVGCLLLEMLSSQPLFPGESDLDQIHHIVRCFGDLTWHHQELFHSNPLFSGVRLPQCSGPQVTLEQRFPSVCDTALSLAQSCLQMEPEKRPECSELLEHVFFTHDSFHIRFSDELNAKIQKDHRENSTLPKISKATKPTKEEPEEKERKHHRLPENVDDKLRTKKETSVRPAKLPKAKENAPETSTRTTKAPGAKDNVPETSTRTTKATGAKEYAPETSTRTTKATGAKENVPETSTRTMKATGAKENATETSTRTMKATGAKENAPETSTRTTKATGAKENAPETSTRTTKATGAKENAAKNAAPIKTKAAKPNELQDAAKMSNSNPAVRAKPSKASSPDARTDDAKEAAKVIPSPKLKVGQSEQSQKFVKSFAMKAGHVSEPQNPSMTTKVLKATGEQVVFDAVCDLEANPSGIMPRTAKRASNTRDETQASADNNTDRTSSQTLERCMSKKTELSTNPSFSETKQHLNQTLEASLPKQAIDVDPKNLKTSAPSQSPSKITLQSLSKIPNANRLRIKAITGNPEQAQSKAPGGRHLTKDDPVREEQGSEASHGSSESRFGRLSSHDTNPRPEGFKECKREGLNAFPNANGRNLQSFILSGPTMAQNSFLETQGETVKKTDPQRLQDPRTDPDMDPYMDLNMDLNMDPNMDPNMDLNMDPNMDLNTDPNMDPDTDPIVDPWDQLKGQFLSSPPPPPSSTPLLLLAPPTLVTSTGNPAHSPLRFIHFLRRVPITQREPTGTRGGHASERSRDVGLARESNP